MQAPERGQPPAAASRPPWWQMALRWETGLVVVLIAALLFGSSESATFTSPITLFYAGINIGYIAVMALPMTLMVVTAEMDPAGSSMLGKSAGLFGNLWPSGWPLWPAILPCLSAGV